VGQSATLLLEDEIHLLRRPQCHTVLVSDKSWLGAPEGSLLRGIFSSKVQTEAVRENEGMRTIEIFLTAAEER